MFKHSSYFKSCFLALFVFLFSIPLLEVASAQSIYLEWVDNPLETMVVNWVDNSGGNATVEYRTVGSAGWSTSSGSNRSIPGSSMRVYTVHLNGLTPGQAYEFRVGGNSDIHKFRTAPNSLETPMKFIVAGDILENGVGYEQALEDFVKVSIHAAAADPYFAVLGGDLAHARGDANNVNQWMDFFRLWHDNMVTDDGFMVPILAAVGNNEVPNRYGDDPEDAVFYYTFFRYPQDQWGSKISYGKLDFREYLSIITLDSDHTQRIPGMQTQWLRGTLNNRQGVRHVIPIYHVAGWPTFASRTLIGPQEDLVRNNWHKVFWDNRIRLVFEHHDHIYKRTFPIGQCDDEIRNEKDCQYGNNAQNGVIYMGGGAWGSDNDRAAENRWYHEQVTDQIHNFVVVEIDGSAQTATAIGENGQVLDEFTDYVFLREPTSLPPDDITPTSFTARWELVEGATNYRIDVSTDPDFDTFFRNNKNKSLGDTNEFELEDLDPEETYYYQVRAENDLTTSDSSDDIVVQLIIIDPNLSSMSAEKNTAVGDNKEKVGITVSVRDEDDQPVENFQVSLFAEEGNLKAVNKFVRTNAQGLAEFQVFNDRAQTVTYGASVGSKEVTQKVQVTYLPVAPVALSASGVQNRQFKANWELVPDTDSYILDVATDNSFSQFVSGYDSRNVGNVTSHTVEAVNPGTEYFYRVRAVTNSLVGINSQAISTITFPDTPEATGASDISVISFKANWNAAAGAKKYRLDVARDQNFEQIVQGYEDLDVGNVQSYEVDGLLPGRNYYYRVQAESEPRLSNNSNIVNATTNLIDTESSEITSQQLRVLANGEQVNEIMIIVRDEEGALQSGVKVELNSENGSSQIEEIQPVTNEEGMAVFGVKNTKPEEVTYSVTAATVDMGEISVEFLPVEGELSLGHNFPNPFRFNSSIPLTIPKLMSVKLQVFNSLGAPVRTLIDEEIETGYYEVPFNGADLAAGVYFYRLITEEGTKTGKMVLVK
ncbi:fibronectin type III domain-containing protein [Rhodohalobacter sp. 614A]|uniref:fibronectin type III domain-containing protein n=1 Tax=Rhodohalobacter sp. 614A TaxID=2908649 RepID=UPI001F38E26E|nr:fibronectin type III domain-containing protein [Rhodohalobacter sp. 614A]